MLYWNEDSLLLGTGLSLHQIAEIICASATENELLNNLEKFGKKYQQRYLLLKTYKEQIRAGTQKLSLCIIIAGLPGTGKTSLAKELSSALDIGVVIGGDALRSSFRSVLAKNENPEFFTSVYNTWKFFGEYTESNLLKGYQKQSRILNQAIQRMIADRGIRDGENLLIEYLHFLPSHFDEEILNHPSVIPIVLRINNRTIYSERLNNRSLFSHLQSSGDRLLEQMDKYLILQKKQCTEVEEYDLPIVDIDDFQEAYDQILDIIFERIKLLIEIKTYDKEITYIEKLKTERKS